jgi:hypothetical protein
MLHWKLVRQRALAEQSHRTGGGNEVRTLAKQIHAAALDERPRRYAPSGTAKQSHRRSKSPSTLLPFTRAILAKRNTPFFKSEIRALQRGLRAGSFAADWHCQHIVMAELVLIGAKIKGPRAFCSLARHPKSGLPDFGIKHVEIGYSRFRLRGGGRRLSTRSDSRRGPLTRNERERRAHSDLSPQAGRGEAARQQLNLAPMGTSPAITRMNTLFRRMNTLFG